MPSALFQPIRLRGLELPNRIVIAPMCQYSAEDGSATDWHMIHLGGYALSGAGLLIIEATGISPEGRITTGCLGLWSDENEAALGRVLKACRRYGNTPIGIQLGHAGRKASAQAPQDGGKPLLEGEPGAWQTVAPSAVPFGDGWHRPLALDREGMDKVVADFVQATQRADRLGIDLIELHGAHGYLLSSFLSPIANQRNDEYGGSLENRMRFPLEVFDAVRAVWPEPKPLGIRFNGTDWDAAGFTPDDAVAFAAVLKERGCDFVDISGGGNSLPRIPVKPGYQVPAAARVKAETGIATMAVGMIREPAYAEEIVASGQADMVALARGMLYEPRWAWRAAEELGAEAAYPPQYERGRPAKWPQAFSRRDAAE
ncbi:2,4-dienoyl-CoA reductase-like NADH-dependent reductase (Old Yellow Enzyme family) [Constrictibacter sp. MBR-5]|jgi:2,4-dienoyl-CoA reductase-like NADH-dependent reductase (Old Yellow Enzyme family)|uniref:NADH:flavin oxidoreductase/NADH oxidase n=1 Tax=Constrictibacter sp. MBR-5 TaxID=3156467 RepID=UPI003397B3F1